MKHIFETKLNLLVQFIEPQLIFLDILCGKSSKNKSNRKFCNENFDILKRFVDLSLDETSY